MGDGQHGWAAAEWVQIVRNIFVREEGNGLILGSGIYPRWMQSAGELAFGPTPTPFGDVGIRIFQGKGGSYVKIDAEWHGDPPYLVIRIPGFRPKDVGNLQGPLLLEAL